MPPGKSPKHAYKKTVSVIGVDMENMIVKETFENQLTAQKF